MSVAVVAAYKVKVPKKVTFSIDPGESVSAMRGTLFRKEGTAIVVVKNWTASQLRNGVNFVVDPQADRFEIDVTATVTADTSITSTATFDPTPPAESVKDVSLKENEGLIERLWFFLPINKQAGA
jgi:hypothetical protein